MPGNGLFTNPGGPASGDARNGAVLGADDLLANVEADLRFHLTIARSCTNRMLQTLYETVQTLLAETQRQPIPRTDPSRMHASIAEHWQIIAALEAGDGQAARAAKQAHITNTAECAGISL